MTERPGGFDPSAPFQPGCGFLLTREVEDYLEGRLGDERAAEFERHLTEGCDACAELQADLAAFRGVVERGPLEIEREEDDRNAEMLRARLNREVRARTGSATVSATPKRGFVPFWGWAAAAASVLIVVAVYVAVRPPDYPTIALGAGDTITVEPKPFDLPPVLRGEPDVAGLWSRARDAYDRGRFEMAAGTLAEIEKAAPDQVDAPIYRGVCLLLVGKNEDALAAFAAAREIAAREDLPTASLSWYTALAHLAKGNKAEARVALEEASRQGGPYAAKAAELLARLP